MFSQEDYSDQENLFRKDAFLLGLSRRFLPAESYFLMAPKLENLGDAIVKRVKYYGDLAERYPPILENLDVFGNRVDRLILSDGWLKLKKFSAENGLIAAGYDKRLRHARRSAQTAMQLMFSAYSSSYSCQLAMTDGAIKLLGEYAPKSIRESLINDLLSKDNSLTCGQWMTERIGGSDLRHIESHATLARKEDDRETYRLFGQKWFCSSIDSEYALVLAKIINEGPTLFLLRVWQAQKLADGVRIERLKNKLGTRALPTAEVHLEGALATMIGMRGKGIYVAAPLLNITRFYNAMASASIMNRAFFGVLSYAKRRKSFGKALIDHDLHHRLLADLDAKRAGATALCFEIARLLGRIEDGSVEPKDSKILRALGPTAKLMLGKWAVLLASDAIEAMGGVGYLEDTEFPKLLRDAQVLPIWEGTTNILVHDMLRSQRKEGALVVLLKDLCERANSLMIDEGDACRILKSRLQQLSEKVMHALNKSEADNIIYLESFARKCAFSLGACTMALLLAEAKPFVTEKDPFASNRFTTFVDNNLCGHFSL